MAIATPRRGSVVSAFLAGCALSTITLAGTPERRASVDAVPSPLLAIDRHRDVVIERIVGQWGEALVRANAGIGAEQLRDLLHAMRADQLLAASLAGTLEGLRNVVSASIMEAPEVKPALLRAKALGDGDKDVVYVPVTPCRLVETRGTFAAVYQGGGPFATNEVRTYTLQGGNGQCLTQLPPSAAPSAIQLQVFGIPTSTGSGDIEILPEGGVFGGTATLVYLGNNAFTTAAVTALVNLANKQIAVQVRGLGAHVAIDVVGYFRPPAGGFVSSVTAGAGLTGGTITSSGTLAADTTYLQRRVAGACAAGSSIRTIAEDGTVVCEADDVGTGTVTSVGAGTGLTGGPITTSGTLAVNTAVIQARVSGTCAAGSSIRAIAADGTVTCETDDAGPANAYVQGGNAFAATAVLGTTDNNMLDVRVNGARVMRYMPDAISPNLIGGHPANMVTAGVRGATIAGGGVASGNSDPSFTNESPNVVHDHYGAIGGGFGNTAGSSNADLTDGAFAVIAGGWGNDATGRASTVAGGEFNSAVANGSFVGGGNVNVTTGIYSGVASGQLNSASDYYAFVGGGVNNAASGNASTVPGGDGNIASGLWSLAAGKDSEARGNYSFALGRRAKTFVGVNPAVGAFVWADSNDFDFAQSQDNMFAARATGGVRFVTAINVFGGATQSFYIGPSGDVSSTGEINAIAFNATSDRNAKTGFAAVDPDRLLEAVASLPIESWSYRNDPQATRHIGPTAQDFRAAFNVGRDDRSIATVDADGIALASIQALYRRLRAKEAEVDALRASVKSLEASVEAMKSR